YGPRDRFRGAAADLRSIPEGRALARLGPRPGHRPQPRRGPRGRDRGGERARTRHDGDVHASAGRVLTAAIPQSSRRAARGLTRAARQAGSRQAATVTATSRAMTAAYVTGSVAPTP